MDFILKGFVKAFYLFVNFDEETFSAVFTTIKVSSLSILLSSLTGFPIGFFIGYFRFPLRNAMKFTFDVMLSLPTVFIGLLVYAITTSRGPLGACGILFSVKAIAIGQYILALPLIISISSSIVEEAKDDLGLTLASLGARGIRFFITYIVEIREGLFTAFLSAYGRILTEVGISMMVGGNIKWNTRTITTAIALETNRGEFANGIALGLILLIVALSVNILLYFLRRKK